MNGGNYMSTLDLSKKMASIAYKALDEKQGEDIRVIDISEVSVIADYFIIANGNNESQVRALVDNAEEALEKEGFIVKQREGYGHSSWTLLDFGDIIIHVFDKENRLFYNLERIWCDGKQIPAEDLN